MTLLIASSSLTPEASELKQLIASRGQRIQEGLQADPHNGNRVRTGRITVDAGTLNHVRQLLEKDQGQALRPRVEFRPFDDVMLVLEFTAVVREGKHVSFIGGVFDGMPLPSAPRRPGMLAFALIDGVIRGSLEIGNLVYLFRHSTREGQIVDVVDISRMQLGTPLPVPKPLANRGRQQGKDIKSKLHSVNAPITADVLIGYTTASRLESASASIQSRISAAIGVMNHAFAKSETGTRIRLVGTHESSYIESGDPTLVQDLNALATSPAQETAKLRKLRDQFGADLVGLWVHYANHVHCGRAYQPSAFEDLRDSFAYGVVQWDCYGGDVQALAHEIGHNLGLGHDLHASSPPPVAMLFPYAHGFVGTNGAPPFRSIMAYPTQCEQMGIACPIEYLFSNPALTHHGIAAGDAFSANESQAIDNVAALIADYRDGPLKDINPGPADGASPFYAVAIGDTIYFGADDGVHGSELWKSDGTRDGTVMVKDLVAGQDSSFANPIVNVGGTLYFATFDPWRYALWKTDGTAEGTTLIARLGEEIGDLVVAGNLLYFTDCTALHCAIWRSNGTPEGTVLLWSPAELYGDDVVSIQLASADGRVFFATAKEFDDESPEARLWVIPAGGTPSPVRAFLSRGARIHHLTPIGNHGNDVLFTVDDGIHGEELWRSSGSESDTFLVRDIHPIHGSYPHILGTMNGIVYFHARTDKSDPALWRTDGTTAGTYVVHNVRPTNDPRAPRMVAAEGVGYFIANDLSHGDELWSTDGTTEGTVRVKSGFAADPASYRLSLSAAHGSTLFFQVTDWHDGDVQRLWKSDGSVSGTLPVKIPGMPDTMEYGPYLTGNQMFVAARSANHGGEIHATSLPMRLTQPGDFTFARRDDVALGSDQISEAVLVTNVEAAVPISVEGGWYAIGCTGNWLLLSSIVAPGQRVCVKHTAGSTSRTRVHTTLTINGVSGTFTSQTLAEESRVTRPTAAQ